MAGAGYKLFNTGDVLTAQQVNEYLQQQTVMVFASSTARTTALSGVLAEGMMSYLQDTNSVEVYNGSAWVGVASDQIPLTTKGDLLTYSTTDTRLPVGTNGQVLQADSTTATGLKWADSSSGSLTLLSTTTLSGTSTTISSISSAYTDLQIVIYGVNINTSGTTFRIAPNNDANISVHQRATGSDTLDTSRTYIFLNSSGTNVTNGRTDNAWVLNIYNYSSTASRKPIIGAGAYYDSGFSNTMAAFVNGFINTTSAISSLVFSNNAGNSFAAGTVLVYGVK